MITTQDASDMPSSMRATPRVTRSPWFHKCIRPISGVMVFSFEDEIDRHVEPHRFGHAAALARNVAPLANGLERGAIDAIEAAGLAKLGLLREAVGTDQDAHDDRALLTEAPARGRIGRRR